MQTHFLSLTKSKSVKKGTTRSLFVDVRDPTNTIDFTGAIVLGTIRKKAGSEALETFDPTYAVRQVGRFSASLTLPVGKTSNLKKGTLFWEVLLTVPSISVVWCVGEGELEVRA